MAGNFGRQAVADTADEMGLDSLARFRGDDRFLAGTQPFADGAVFVDDGAPGTAPQANGTVAEPRDPTVVDGADPFGKSEQCVYVLIGPDTWAYRSTRPKTRWTSPLTQRTQSMSWLAKSSATPPLLAWSPYHIFEVSKGM